MTTLLLIALGSCSNGDVFTRTTDSGIAASPETVTTFPTTSTSATTSTTTTTVAPTTTTVAPTTTTDPIARAQQDYLAMASTVNTAMANLYAPYASLGYIPWADFPQYCAAAAAAEEEFTTAMRTYVWPRQARTAAALQVTINAELTADYQECARTEATEAALTDVNARITAADARSAAAANNFRAAMGLPLNH